MPCDVTKDEDIARVVLREVTRKLANFIAAALPGLFAPGRCLEGRM